VSGIVEWVKVLFKDSAHENLKIMGLLIGLSVLGGFGMWWLKAVGFWDSVVAILVFAAAIWALVLRQFEK
jgi:hypothetical protein